MTFPLMPHALKRCAGMADAVFRCASDENKGLKGSLKLILRTFKPFRLSAAVLLSAMGHLVVFASAYYLTVFDEPTNNTQALPLGDSTTFNVSFEPLLSQPQPTVLTPLSQDIVPHSKRPFVNRKTDSTAHDSVKGKVDGSSLTTLPTKPSLSHQASLRPITDLKPYAQNPLPIYPEEERQEGNQATCSFLVSVTGDGEVSTIAYDESDSGQNCVVAFQKAARHALKQWKFHPPSRIDLHNTYRVDINFLLQD